MGNGMTGYDEENLQVLKAARDHRLRILEEEEMESVELGFDFV